MRYLARVEHQYVPRDVRVKGRVHLRVYRYLYYQGRTNHFPFMHIHKSVFAGGENAKVHTTTALPL